MVLNPRNKFRILFKTKHLENIKDLLEIKNMRAELKHSIGKVRGPSELISQRVEHKAKKRK